MINLDGKQSEGAHWVSLFIDRLCTALYFYSFQIEYIQNIFRVQDDDFIMCGLYCIAFIEYMLTGKTLLDYTNVFSPNGYKKNDKIILKSFKDKYDKP